MLVDKSIVNIILNTQTASRGSIVETNLKCSRGLIDPIKMVVISRLEMWAVK